jgi:UDP-glucose 4-epimerase
MNVVILGAQGFIGNYLTQYFAAKGMSVFGCDLFEYSSTIYNYQKVSILSPDFEIIFEQNKFDVCINASGSGNVGHSLAYPISDFEANTIAVAKILDTLRKHQSCCKYIHISSAAVYGNPAQLPIKETDDLKPISPYGYHKMMSEILCKEYFDLYKIPIAIIRPFSVFGNGLKKQLLWDICCKLKDNESVRLYGTGYESRDFLHISDLVSFVDSIIHKGSFKCEAYNAASGREVTIKAIANIFEENYKPQKKIIFSGELKHGDPIHWRADIARIQKLGVKPCANFDNSVIEYINWFSKFGYE